MTAEELFEDADSISGLEPVGAPEQELRVLPLFMQDGILEGDRRIVGQRPQEIELVM